MKVDNGALCRIGENFAMQSNGGDVQANIKEMVASLRELAELHGLTDLANQLDVAVKVAQEHLTVH